MYIIIVLIVIIVGVGETVVVVIIIIIEAAPISRLLGSVGHERFDSVQCGSLRFGDGKNTTKTLEKLLGKSGGGDGPKGCILCR